ncbi:hypothetical protein DVB69_14040 [Sporosarcina sp. BI001-red]|uniref:hypothetical protein n=1 Tax=Sporosarcina sp. BI001-red TaxID=2282866 RepID=UPI000E22A879|nr:hypothetical protein [Sporosarcina sp. BI001-red]REB06052.1 hypothetical protein DVB69_14040 [Sporosarcina sp. BI001-red]
MKKTLITAVSALLISAGGAQAATYAHADHNANAQSSYAHVQQNSNYGQQVNQDITGLEEYASIASVIDPTSFTTRVTEDNVNNRVILFSDNYGRTQYKSVFVKKTGLLKVINLNGGGAVLVTTVKADTATPAPEVKPVASSGQSASAISSLPEYKTLAGAVDLTDLTPVIVSDNYNNRTILLKDANGREQYKSVFVKNTGLLKVINLKGQGVVIETVVKEDAATPAPEVKPEQKPEAKPQQPSSTISSLPEYKTLAAHVDLSALTPVVVSNNYNNRTIVLKDANGREQFKSIYVNRTNMLKIINLKGGQIFYGAAQ